MTNISDAIYSVAQIRQAERIAIEDFGISGWQLMQRAGLALFKQLQQHWPASKQLSVFCGAGNNAGDGYVIATLALQHGYLVQVYALISPALLQGDAQTAYAGFIQAGGKVAAFSTATNIAESAIVVDALFGTGLNRPVSGDFAVAINLINYSACPVVAVDLPSGINADSGAVMGMAVHADLTVTFIGHKGGLHSGDALNYVGKWVLDTLDLPAAVFAGAQPVAALLQKQPLPARPKTAHKGCFGHVLLIGGNLGYSGAIRLAAEAALRSGAGLVSVATRTAHSAFVNIGRPELMCHAVETAEQLQPLLEKASVVVIGPGLGQDAWAQNLFACVKASNKPCVVDADALNLLAQQPQKSANWILTPHPGEAARLLNCATADIALDRFAALTALQQGFGGVCILKGAGSLIGNGQTVYINHTGNPGMASGGMGDVLAGIIGALLAQGLSPLAAAGLGVYIHGEAAERVAAKQGPIGMLASDLFPELGFCLYPPHLGQN